MWVHRDKGVGWLPLITGNHRPRWPVVTGSGAVNPVKCGPLLCMLTPINLVFLTVGSDCRNLQAMPAMVVGNSRFGVGQG